MEVSLKLVDNIVLWRTECHTRQRMIYLTEARLTQKLIRNDKRIRYLTNKRNDGRSYLNIRLVIARGDYTAAMTGLGDNINVCV